MVQSPAHMVESCGRRCALAVVLQRCLRHRDVCIEQDAMEVIGRQEWAIRPPGCPQQGLPTQQVVVAQEYGRGGPGEELAHSCSRIPAIDQVTSHYQINRRQGQRLIAPRQAGEMGQAIALQLLGSERKGAGSAVVEVEVATEAANYQRLQANPRPQY